MDLSTGTKAKIKGKKPEIRILVHITFFDKWKFGTLACPKLSYLGHGIRIRSVPKNLGQLATLIMLLLCYYYRVCY